MSFGFHFLVLSFFSGGLIFMFAIDHIFSFLCFVSLQCIVEGNHYSAYVANYASSCWFRLHLLHSAS